LSRCAIAPSQARRILRGESPRRVRASHPPVSSLASVAESREGRTRQAKRRQRILQAVGVVAHPEVLVQLRDWLAADAEGFNVHRRQHRSTRDGEGVEVRRSRQAVACRKRYVGELGRPSRLLPAGRVLVGCTALEARKGKPGYGVMPGPTRAHTERRVRQAEEYCQRESPPYAEGESYQA
jgi:hypothetical protein